MVYCLEEELHREGKEIEDRDEEEGRESNGEAREDQKGDEVVSDRDNERDRGDGEVEGGGEVGRGETAMEAIEDTDQETERGSHESNNVPNKRMRYTIIVNS